RKRALDASYRGFISLLAGQITAALANARAYEAERRRVAALAELDRAKTAFFSNVSHEFRTPLTLMLGPLEDALSEASEPQQERLALIHRNGLRLLKLVNSLLDFSRIEAGREQAFYEPTDLSLLTRELASVFRSAVERAGLELALDCPPLAEPIWVDREMWEKIVLNLLSNAFKFTFEGRIEVCIKPAGNAVELIVRDTGIGIAKADQTRLFERFHRIEGARGRTHEGSGIGLALVQELAHLHGGKISVESTPDQGSAFIVSLPCGFAHLPAERLNQPARRARSPKTTAAGAAAYVEEALRWLPSPAEREGRKPSSHHSIETHSIETHSIETHSIETQSTQCDERLAVPQARILLADDNADMRDYVRRLLSANYEVEAVADGEAALTAARVRLPDLVLSDVMMPRLDGFGLLQALRADARTATIPVILLSARAGEESRVEGLEAGADDYLIKPFSARELLARVESNLQLQRLRGLAAQRAEQLTLIADTAPVYIAHCDVEGRFKFVNRAYAERFGLTPADCLGKHLSEIVGESAYKTLRQYVEAALRGERVEFEVELTYARLGKLLMHAAYAPEFEANGKVVGFVAAITDISERKRAAAALQASETRFAKAFNASPLAITLTSLKTGQLIEVNETFVRVTGYTRAEALGKTTLELGLWDPADRNSELATVQRAGLIRAAEYKFRLKDGTEIIGLLSAELLEIGGESCALTVIQDITERKRAEQALRASEERFRTLSESLPQIIWVSREDNATLDYANAQWMDYTGMSYEESLRNPSQAMHPDDLPGVLAVWHEALRQGTPYEVKLRLRNLTGTYRWFLTRGVPVRDEAGKIVRWFGSSTDIHAQIEDEQDVRLLAEVADRIRSASIEMEDAEQLLADVAELIGHALELNHCFISEMDEAHDSWWVVQNYHAALPSLAGEYRISDFPAFITTELRAGRTLVVEDAQADRRSADYYEAAFAPLGIRAYVVVPFMRDGRWVASLVAAVNQPRAWAPREITLLETIAERLWAAVEKVRLDAAMRASEEKFRDMADNISQFAWMADTQGWIFWYNQRWYDYTGTTLEQMQGWGWRTVHHPDHLERVIERLQRSWDTGEVWEDTFPLRGKDGAYRWFLSRALPIRDAAGKVLRWFGTNTDVTEQRAAEEALREADRRKDEFLAVVSHELRSPLNAILGWARMLHAQRRDDPEITRITEIIQRNGRTQIQLIEDLLDTARIISGKLRLETRPVALIEIIAAALDTVRPAAESKHIALETVYEMSSPESHSQAGGQSIGQITGDADRLQQVVWNLLANAVKFTPEGGRVSLTLRQPAEGAQIVVSDTGQGIPPELLPYVFDRFRQGDSSSSRRFGGLGLGLALVKHLVELHGGHVQVTSAGSGQGSTFTVTLPVGKPARGKCNVEATIHPASRAASTAAKDHADLLKGLRVLVVDDDEAGREWVALTLRQAGALVTLVDSAAAARAALTHATPDAPFDLLLSDIGMPGEDGYEMMRHVRAHADERVRSIRAVALTAYTRTPDRLKALQAGFQTHLAKPVEEDELLAVVASLSGRLRAHA
ncbi:MAG: PAS domain S-box protein, partial [Acidobacteria bacterium]|nr:PAS domain S-box protein [Acidobacteriota bacterium]